MLAKHALLPIVLLSFLSGGCAGPHALRHSRAKYGAVVQVTRNEQLLLNLVRLRYRDTPSFLDLSSLTTQFSFDESAGVAGTIKENSKNFNVLGLNAGFDASERPTASYTPLQGESFVTKLISPIEEETIVLLTRSGWKGSRVFRLAVQSLNGLANLRTASGPTPTQILQSEIKDSEKFRELFDNLEQYSQSKLIRFNYETVEIPKSTTMPTAALTPRHAVEAAQNGLQIIHQHKEVSIAIWNIQSASPVVASYLDNDILKNVIEEVRRDGLKRPIRVKFDGKTTGAPFIVLDDDLLFLAAKAIHEDNPKRFSVIPCDVVDEEQVVLAGTSQKLVMTWDAEQNDKIRELGLPNLSTVTEGRYMLQIEPRSLLGAMYYLSHAIRVPPEHEQSGLVVTTFDPSGNPFDWATVTRDLLYIESSATKPACAAVAVKYRGYWFYIDDRDHSSKATFSLLMSLFELRAGGGADKGPVLTLPVGI